MAYTVHIAGEVIDNRQLCVRCGEPLIDYRGVMVASADGEGPGFWERGKLVATSGGFSMVIDDRPLEADEIYCTQATALV